MKTITVSYSELVEHPDKDDEMLRCDRLISVVEYDAFVTREFHGDMLVDALEAARAWVERTKEMRGLK